MFDYYAFAEFPCLTNDHILFSCQRKKNDHILFATPDNEVLRLRAANSESQLEGANATIEYSDCYCYDDD
jgi:hypothetical protein